MNLILGSVHNLEYDELRPFLESLKMVGYSGKVTFFVSNISDDTFKALEDYGVDLLTLDEDDPLKNVTINSLRYFVYRSYLDQLTDDVEYILLADVRDIIFQCPPFDWDIPDALCCFLENKDLPLKDCEVNYSWLRAAYGDEIAEEIGDNNISCSGTTMGPRNYIQDYLFTMCKELLSISTGERRGITQHHGGIDQGVHNYLIHKDKLDNVQLFANEEGLVLTMHHVDNKTLCYDDVGSVINANGLPYHLLHQYDRHWTKISFSRETS